jgi:uncharacterized integral membrane protein
VARKEADMTTQDQGDVAGGAAPADIPDQPQPQPPPEQGAASRRGRLRGLWIALASSALVLVLLLIFILENGQRIDVAYFGAHGHLPLGVALLFAAVFGNLVVLIPWAARAVRLRAAARPGHAPWLHRRAARTPPAS